MQLFAGLIRLETAKFVCLLKSQAGDSAASSQLAGTFWMLRATATYGEGKRLYKETKHSKALLYMHQVILQFYMIYLFTAIGLSPGGSSTVHINTQTIHRTIQNNQYIEQHNNFGRVRAVPRHGWLYPGICLTTEEKARKNFSNGSRV
jgi:hypothetical protein